MLQNAYFLAEIGADTAENEQHFAKICQKLATTLGTGSCWLYAEVPELLRPVAVRPRHGGHEVPGHEEPGPAGAVHFRSLKTALSN